MQLKIEQDTRNIVKLSRPQGKIIDIKCEKSQWVGHFELFQAIFKFFRENEQHAYKKF